MRPADANPGRDETPEQRDDRNLVEFMQELRVGAIGVQVLFGFLLSLPFFDSKFTSLSEGQKDLWMADLLLAALATALLTAPVAYHRLVFRRHLKEQLIHVANVMAIAGLGAVALAVSGSILLAADFVEKNAAGPVIGALTLVTFVFLWFMLPLIGRYTAERERR